MDDRNDKAANDPKQDPILVWAERFISPLAWLGVIAAIIFILLVWNIAAAAEVLSGRVVGVADGDTITVLDLNHRQHKVRLAGIDAPEKKQAFGNRSKQHLSELVFGKPVSVEWTKHDRYGRIVGKVWVAPRDACPDVRPDCPKTLDSGLAMLTVGLAWHYKQYEKEQTQGDRARYAFTEEEARAKRAGLWSNKGPIPPWEWRRVKE